jgi:tRNA G18 (ribose-2'-O)-methylase SpoU
MNFFPQSLLFKNILSTSKIIYRYRRVQTRKPLAVYKDFNEAAEKTFKDKQKKEETKKQPVGQQKKIPRVEFITTDKSKIDEKAIFNELQKEANRIYYKHDPYSKGDGITKDMFEDITENVDMLAYKLTKNKEDYLNKIINLTDGDHRFGPSIQIAKSNRHRYEKKKILLEGKRLILDALESGVKIESLFLLKNTLLKQLDFDFSKLDYEIKFYQVSQKSISLWSDVETSQGFIAIAKMPSPGECRITRTLDLPFILVLDQVKDPGNMGTIIRTAAAIGCEKILLSKGCVDIWDPKVIRSGMGAQFRVPILNNLAYEQIETYLPSSTKLLFADNPKPNDPFNIKKYDFNNLNEIMPHKTHVTLVMGNETAGLSNQIFGLASNKISGIVNIPLENGVESLNCSVAFSILGYEIRKLMLSIK